MVLLSGTVLADQQVVDLANPVPFDTEIATELSGALATQRDAQILNGTGSSKQTLGLLNASGTTATAYTDASPSTQKYLREGIAKNWSAVAAALGQLPDTILLHPTAYTWLYSGYDTTNKRPISSDLLAALCAPNQVPAIPTNVGSNKNEVPTIILNRNQVRLYLNPPVLQAAPDQTESGKLIVRYTIRQLCSVVIRKPVGVGIVLGTGTKSSPAFT